MLRQCRFQVARLKEGYFNYFVLFRAMTCGAADWCFAAGERANTKRRMTDTMEDNCMICQYPIEPQDAVWYCGGCTARLHKRCVGDSHGKIVKIKSCPQCRQGMVDLKAKATETHTAEEELYCLECPGTISIGERYKRCANNACNSVWCDYHIVHWCISCGLGLHRAIQARARAKRAHCQ